ncbi:hypothetical protein M422DRAFT_270328 [Sphaerobolus stellatus SS14]|uniref:Protein kinase domain-containing protein n=1 Tax=Sphaerobolus stellatus (strain SS14) TaxID=990650 RepID=A0A0C9U2P3_SPHS4|nr:hypothetical protein M422DRAFT_270328 [Sphaerobolus stellatus SS14]
MDAGGSLQEISSMEARRHCRAYDRSSRFLIVVDKENPGTNGGTPGRKHYVETYPNVLIIMFSILEPALPSSGCLKPALTMIGTCQNLNNTQTIRHDTRDEGNKIVYSRCLTSSPLRTSTFCEMLTVVRNVLSRKKERIRSPNRGGAEDWILHAMNIAKITAEAAKMIPLAGPFIEGGANVFYMVLESLKQSKDNKEDIMELTQSITKVLEILQKAVSGTPRAEHSEDFMKTCSEFRSLMKRLLKDHNQLIAESQSRPIRNYLRSGEIKRMISRYQKDINILRNDLAFYCTVSTHLQVQMFKIDGSSANVPLVTRTNDDHILEFEEFHEFKQGDIHLQKQIKYNIRTRYSRVGVSPFKEHYASALVYGTPHRTTVRVFEGEESKEHLKALLRYLAPLRHDNIVQIMGFCKSHFMPAVIFYEDLQPPPVRVLNQYGLLDLIWNTIEDLTTRYRMSRDIQDGVRHMQAKLPSFLKGEINGYAAFDFDIVRYTEPGKAQLGIHFGNDNRVKISILLSDTGPNSFMTSDYSSTDVIIDEKGLKALHTQLESRVARSPAETTSLLQNFHSVIPVGYGFFPLDSDKVLLGGVYARYLPCSTCQQCSVPYHLTSLAKEVKLVAGFTSHDYNVYNWELSTSSSEVWSSLKHIDKGIRLSFTESHITEKITLFQHCYAVNDSVKDTLLWNSFLAEIYHFKSRFDAICPSSKCKLLALNLVYAIRWYIELEVENTPGTWPVNELYLFAKNAIMSDYGNCQVPNIYWSQCPQGTTRLTALELHTFGIHYLPKLTCECKAISFNFEKHNIKLLQKFYKSCGLDPFSDEVARAAGYILPRHFNLGDTKKRRRRSFTGYPRLHEYRKENIFSINDMILDDTPLYHYLGNYCGRQNRPLSFNSHLQNVLRLRESNSRLGIRPSRYWAFLAAAEVLPESLRWYDLRTTGHDFAYGEVNIDPRYAELPSRAQEFWSMSVHLGISVEEYLWRWEDYLASEDVHPHLWWMIFPESLDTD